MEKDILNMVYEEESTNQVSLNLTDEEKTNDEIAQMAGAIKMAKLYGSFSQSMVATMFHKAKTSKSYKKVGTWDQFCKRYGFSRSKVDDMLRTMNTLGKETYIALHDLKLKEQDIKFISNNQKAIEKVASNEGEIIEITLEDDKKITIDKNNPAEIKEWIESAVKSAKESKEAAVKAMQDAKEITATVTKECDAKRAELEKELEQLKPSKEPTVEELEKGWDVWRIETEANVTKFKGLWNKSVKTNNPELMIRVKSMLNLFNDHIEDLFALIEE